MSPAKASSQAMDLSFRTARLELMPATAPLTRLAMLDGAALGAALDAAIPPTWPHDYLDRDAFEFLLARLESDPGQLGWWMYFLILTEGGMRTLIGSAGYKGPPDADGLVEVGYGIVSDRRRRGFASEAVRGLLDRAFARGDVRRAIAETLPELTGSIAVLERCGFQRCAGGSEPGVLRFELTRAAYAAGRAVR